MQKYIVLGVFLACGGCATPYQDMGFLGGVEATRVDQTTLTVSARGNAFTEYQDVTNYIFLKAAEETQRAGYDYFEIFRAEDTSTRETTIREGYTDHMPFPGGHTLILHHPGSTSSEARPGATAMVKMYKGQAPNKPDFYAAADVISHLSQTVSR